MTYLPATIARTLTKAAAWLVDSIYSSRPHSCAVTREYHATTLSPTSAIVSSLTPMVRSRSPLFMVAIRPPFAQVTNATIYLSGALRRLLIPTVSPRSLLSVVAIRPSLTVYETRPLHLSSATVQSIIPTELTRSLLSVVATRSSLTMRQTRPRHLSSTTRRPLITTRLTCSPILDRHRKRANTYCVSAITRSRSRHPIHANTHGRYAA